MSSPVGLCVVCRFGERVESGRGSVFLRCRRHDEEPRRFAKYPRLPILRCAGFEEKDSR